MSTQFAIATVPFVSVAGFKAHPTYLDVQNLRSGDSTGIDQDQELYNLLLISTHQAETYCRQPLQAHLQTDSCRLRPDRQGRLYLYPDHDPVRRLVSYQYSSRLGAFSTFLNPPCQIEDGRQIIVEIGGGNSTWSGALQISAPPSFVDLFVNFSYVAGFANTVLSTNAVAASGSIQVADPTGIEPGDHIRIWDPGTEEILTVSSSYVPNPVYPPVPTTIPLAAGQPLSNHIAGTGPAAVSVSGVPHDMYLAVVYLMQDTLQRPGSSGAEWPGSKQPIATGKKAKPNSIYQEKAWNLLAPYQDVR